MSEEVTRYDLSDHGDSPHPHQDGDWVRYADHVAELASANALIAECREVLRPFAEEADEWSDYHDTAELVEPFPEVDSKLVIRHLRAAKQIFTKLEGKEG